MEIGSETYEVYEGRSDVAFKAASSCLSIVPVVGYMFRYVYGAVAIDS